MKIGFDAKRAFFNNRGLGNYSRDTIRILSKLNPIDDFFLFTPKEKIAINFDKGANCQVVSPKNYLYRKMPSLWRSYGMVTNINKLNLDIYHGLSHELPLGIEKTGIKTVVTMHDLIFLQFPELYPWIDRKFYTKKYLHSCRIANRIIAISNQTKQDLVELAAIPDKKIDVIYQGCNPIFKNKSSEAQKSAIRTKYNLPQQYLLNVGAIERRKNQLLILDALVKGSIDIPLVILGRPTDYITELKNFVLDNKLSKRVIFLTNIPYTELPTIYQMSSLFVYPSIFEGFGIPIVEAMTSNVPVITSRGSCFEETGGSAALYINHKSADELADNIISVLSDEKKRADMINDGLKHIQIFSDDAISEKIVDLYKHLL